MKLETRAPAVLRRSLLLAALVGALLLHAHAAAPASTAPGAARAKAVVGEVVALGGSKRLSVRRSSGGLPRRLETGDKLRLGDHVVMGSRVTATLRLKRPKGVSADTDLIDLAPATGADHDVVVSRTGTRTTQDHAGAVARFVRTVRVSRESAQTGPDPDADPSIPSSALQIERWWRRRPPIKPCAPRPIIVGRAWTSASL